MSKNKITKSFYPVNGDFVKGIYIVDDGVDYSFELLFARVSKSEFALGVPLQTLRSNIQANVGVVKSDLKLKHVTLIALVDSMLAKMYDKPDSLYNNEITIKSVKFSLIALERASTLVMDNPTIGSVSSGYVRLNNMYYEKQAPFSNNMLSVEEHQQTDNPLLDLKEIEVLRQPELDNLLQEFSHENVNTKESL